VQDWMSVGIDVHRCILLRGRLPRLSKAMRLLFASIIPEVRGPVRVLVRAGGAWFMTKNASHDELSTPAFSGQTNNEQDQTVTKKLQSKK